jgi:hypothetical protein
MALVGGGSGFGGTYAYHARMGGDHPGTQPEMIQRLDDAVARQQKLEDTVHSLELSNERVNTRLDAIHDDLTDIKALLRRGR